MAAMDHDHPDHLPRIGAQVLAGTSGIEPGVFAEWRLHDAGLQVRPEVFVNEDGKVGGGGAVAWELGFFNLPERNALALGPRVVFHNSDESGWELDLMAIWSFDLVPSQRGRHFLEVIGAVGVLEEEEENGSDEESVVGASIGIGYGFQF
jgi:hypothetical protein